MLKYWIVFTLLVIPRFLYADTLWLKNGDQISGKLLYLDFNYLLFKAQYVGRLNISVKNIRTLSSNQPIQMKLKSGEDLIISFLYPGEAGTLALDDKRIIALKDIEHLAQLQDRIDGWHWKGNLDIAIELEEEDNTKNGEENTESEFEITAKLDTRLYNSNWRHRLKGDIEKKSENSQRKDNDYRILYDLDRFFDEHWFGRLRGNQERDYLDDDRLIEELGGGIGYQFWDNKRGRFSLTTQLLRHQESNRSESNDVSISTKSEVNTVGLDWDFLQHFGIHGLEVFTKGSYSRPYQEPKYQFHYRQENPNGDDVVLTNRNDILKVEQDPTLNIETGIRYHLTQRLHLSFRHEYNHASSHLSLRTRDRTSNQDVTIRTSQDTIERRFFLGIGVAW